MKKKIVIIVAFSLLLLAAMIILANPNELYSALKQMNFYYILAVIILYFVNMMTKASRWFLLVKSADKKKVTFTRTLPLYVIGLTVNNFTPGRLAGEPVRAYLLRTKADVPVAKGLATIFAERLMDLIVLTVIAIIGVILMLSLLPISTEQDLLLAFGFVIILIVIMLYVVLHPNLLQRTGQSFVKFVRKITNSKWSAKFEHSLISFTNSFQQGFKEVSANKKIFSISFVLTIAIWLNEALRIYLVLIALNISVSSFGAVLIASSVASVFGGIIPAGVGNAAAITVVFTAIGVNLSDATATSILSVMPEWLSVPFGIIAMFFVGLKLKNLSQGKNWNNKEDLKCSPL